MFFAFGLLLLLLLLKILVANSFDLWQKDSFFCDAEDVLCFWVITVVVVVKDIGGK